MIQHTSPERAVAFLCALLGMALGCASPPSLEFPTPAQIVLVRHAEKAGPVGDAPLTPEGEARARELARMLGDADISMIYTSQYLRNVDTAKPLAQKRGIEPIVLPADDVNELVELLRMTTPGTTALVVSHQDKLVEIVAALGDSTPPIPDLEYDRMVVLTLAGGKTHLLTLRFGAPSAM